VHTIVKQKGDICQTHSTT